MTVSCILQQVLFLCCSEEVFDLRILLLFTCGYVCGCLCGVYLLDGLLPVIFGAAALLLALLARFLKFRFSGQSWLALLGLGTALLWCCAYRQMFVDPAFSAAGTHKDSYAEICSYPIERGSSLQVDAYIPTERGSAKATIYLNDCADHLKPGDVVIGTFRLRPSNRRQDGTAFLYYQSKGVLLTGSASVSEVQKAERVPLRYYPQRLSEGIRIRLSQIAPPDAAPFLKAIMTGDRSSLSYGTVHDLSVAGLSHIIAVSGMHVSILIGALYLLLGRGRKRSALVGIPVLLLFMLLTGMSPSVVRASVMLGIFLFARLLRRENDTPTALSAAALVILLHNPWAISNLGFQLSFLAVCGLLICSGPLYRHFRAARPWSFILNGKEHVLRGGKLLRWLLRIVRWLVNGALGVICSTIGALIFTVPVIALVYGSFSTYAMLSNLLALWAVFLCFSGGFLAVALSVVSIPAGTAVAWLTAWPVRYILWISRIISSLPMASLPISLLYTKLFLIFAYVVAALVFLLRERKYGKPLLCVLAALVAAAVFIRLDSGVKTDVIAALDVGQGQSICILARGQSALIDCGGSDADEAGAHAADYLRRAGFDRLDYLIVSHYDADHVGGIPELLREIEVARIYLPDVPFHSDHRMEIEEAARKSDAELCYVSEDTVLSFGDASLHLMAPVSMENDNAASVSVLYSDGDYDMLVTGDLDQAGEHSLLQMHALPDVEVYVAGHHGSNGSSGMELLRAIQPETVLISVGKNSYGHPSEALLQRLSTIDAVIYRTDQSGDIEIRR